MRQAPDLLTTLDVDLPDFAARHATDLAAMLPDWPTVHDPEQPYITGACTLFALALRGWSRGRLALVSVYGQSFNNGSTATLHVHTVGILPLPGGLVGVDATGLNELRTGWYTDHNNFNTLSALTGFGRCGYLRALYVAGRSPEQELRLIAHLSDAMDAEIGDGAELFAELPPQPVDGTKLLD